MICANAAAQPFPGIGFQITNEEVLTDDLPCYEQEQTTGLYSSLSGRKQGKVILRRRKPLGMRLAGAKAFAAKPDECRRPVRISHGA